MRRIVALAVVLLITPDVHKTAEATVDGNKNEHKVMCVLARLAGGTVQAPKISDEAEAAADTIAALNMSTSGPTWQALFNTTEGQGEWEHMPEQIKSAAFKEHWKANWETWRSAKKKAETDKLGQAENKNFPPIPDAGNKQAAHARIDEINVEARHLAKEYIKLKDQATKTAPAEATKKLRQALVGGTGDSDKPTVGNTMSAVDNWANGCTGVAQRKTIVGDFICVCKPTDATEKTCAGGYAGTQWSGSIADIATEWKALKDSCPDKADKAVTHNEIHSAIALFVNTVQTKSTGTDTATRLGESDDGSCSGQSTQLCVVYTDYFKKGAGPGLKGIPWVSNLLAAADEIDKMKQLAVEAKTAGALIAGLLQRATAVYHQAAAGTLYKPKETITEATEKASKLPDPGCNNFKTNTTCKSPCTWHENESDKDKKCKLDPIKVAEQQTQAGKDGGNGETKTTDKCSQAKTPEECAAVKGDIPKDRKAVCGWIEDKCQDSSILVSKQFALSMVSAAFMALLF
ncbi:variant surface glycoprotein (VSG), putative [Trypanosoma equiperdum]|uniref:Variant surface glycoprotein (VSG), putative n=1 Tax=Trypanosoma equiperdum TaxID=5694 RepID=A0A1G4IDG3_TRYEQ|nr:variant surface glycoprotein (VSG), putative [Trypanosoma equiperdum]